MAGTSAYNQIIDEVSTQITALSLSGLSNVVKMKSSTIRKKEVAGLPACLISPFGQPVMIKGDAADNIGVNLIQYPVAVLLVQVGNQNQTTNFDRLALWLEKIVMEFHHKEVAAVTAGNVYSCDVSPRETFQQDAWLDNLDLGGLVLRFPCQLTRS